MAGPIWGSSQTGSSLGLPVPGMFVDFFSDLQKESSDLSQFTPLPSRKVPLVSVLTFKEPTSTLAPPLPSQVKILEAKITSNHSRTPTPLLWCVGVFYRESQAQVSTPHPWAGLALAWRFTSPTDTETFSFSVIKNSSNYTSELLKGRDVACHVHHVAILCYTPKVSVVSYCTGPLDLISRNSKHGASKARRNTW